jgi:hypothetical protein
MSDCFSSVRAEIQPAQSFQPEIAAFALPEWKSTPNTFVPALLCSVIRFDAKKPGYLTAVKF